MSFAKSFRGVFSKVIKHEAPVDPAAFVDNESQEINISVPGAKVGDFVLVAPGVDVTEATFSASVSAADNVSLVLSMTGGDTNNLASSTWKFTILGW